jgi:hypothetical protein
MEQETRRFTFVLALMMSALFAVVLVLSGFKTLALDSDLKQTLIVLTTGTWSFFFGSSTGSKSKDPAQAPAPLVPPEITATTTTTTRTVPGEAPPAVVSRPVAGSVDVGRRVV